MERYKKEIAFGWDILDKYRDKYKGLPFDIDCIIGILNGGVFPAVLLSKLLKIEIFWTRVKFYEGRDKKEMIATDYDLGNSYFIGCKILLVDDIIDSTETYKYIQNCCYNYGVDKVLGSVLVTKDREFCDKNSIDYLKVVDKDVWVKFPWENKEE